MKNIKTWICLILSNRLNYLISNKYQYGPSNLGNPRTINPSRPFVLRLSLQINYTVLSGRLIYWLIFEFRTNFCCCKYLHLPSCSSMYALGYHLSQLTWRKLFSYWNIQLSPLQMLHRDEKITWHGWHNIEKNECKGSSAATGEQTHLIKTTTNTYSRNIT